MILTNREKRTISIAAGGGAAVLLIYFVGLPLWNRWTALGAALEPKVLLLEKLQERAKAQNALLVRRDALAQALGAVEGRAAPSGPAQSAPPSASPPAGENPTKPSKPATSGPAGPGAAPASPGAPPHAVTLAAYIERQASAAGIRFNSVTPFTPAHSYKGGKSLAPAGVVVTLETATPAFLRLLYALEKGDRLVRVETMEIHRDIKKGSSITATLHLVGYEAVVR